MVLPPAKHRRSAVAASAVQSRNKTVDLLETCRLVHALLTKDFCDQVFASTRLNERQRVWSLHALATFWTGVILESPVSLTEAVEDAVRAGLFQLCDKPPSPQGFFDRAKSLKWIFFAEMFDQFVAAITPQGLPLFASEFAFLRQHFAEVWVLDGSRLDAVSHRLKILWNVRSAVLPGCLMAAYDLFRGYPRALRFDADAARGEIPRATELLDQVPPGTLLIMDRGFTGVQFFEELNRRKVYGLCRMKKGLKVCMVEALQKRQILGRPLEDWLVDVGSGKKTPAQRLRLITWRCGKDVFKLLTNVLDPTKLSAEVALDLYRKRWSVERMYFDLKEVFNLNQFYASNPNGVAMQVYAAAIVYVAMRVAQGRAAQHAHVEPEDISTAKFFPRMATAYATHSGFEVGYQATCDANPGVELKKPDPTGHPRFTANLKDILVHPRSGVRRKRRYCEGRKKWKSFAHIPGAKSLMKLT